VIASGILGDCENGMRAIRDCRAIKYVRETGAGKFRPKILIVEFELNPVTPTLSDALALTTTEDPKTVAPDDGAVMETAGAMVSTTALTVTVTDCDVLPPVPVHVRV